MHTLRRRRIPGGCYFFTVNLADLSSNLLVDKVDVLRACVRRVHLSMPFHIDAWVVLPEHMHCVWTLPAGDPNYSRRWQAIKMAFSRTVEPGENLTGSGRSRGERGIWQRRFWEHAIRNDRDYATHVDYIHFNPVMHGLVSDVSDWPFSSLHRGVREGIYPAAWANPNDAPGVMGERR